MVESPNAPRESSEGICESYLRSSRSHIAGLALGVLSSIGCAPQVLTHQVTVHNENIPPPLKTDESDEEILPQEEICTFSKLPCKSELAGVSPEQLRFLDWLHERGISVSVKDGKVFLNITDFQVFNNPNALEELSSRNVHKLQEGGELIEQDELPLEDYEIQSLSTDVAFYGPPYPAYGSPCGMPVVPLDINLSLSFDDSKEHRTVNMQYKDPDFPPLGSDQPCQIRRTTFSRATPDSMEKYFDADTLERLSDIGVGFVDLTSETCRRTSSGEYACKEGSNTVLDFSASHAYFVPQRFASSPNKPFETSAINIGGRELIEINFFTTLSTTGCKANVATIVFDDVGFARPSRVAVSKVEFNELSENTRQNLNEFFLDYSASPFSTDKKQRSRPKSLGF